MARFLLLIVALVFSVCDAQICAPGWTFFEGNCYRWYGSPRVSWNGAEEYCEYVAPFDCVNWGYDCSPHLVSIHSPIENEFVSIFWKTSREPVDPNMGQHFWIGLSQHSGFNQWSNMEYAYFINWDNGEPNLGNDPPYCAVMWKGANNEDVGKWDDQPCYLEKPFMCKYQPQ